MSINAEVIKQATVKGGKLSIPLAAVLWGAWDYVQGLETEVSVLSREVAELRLQAERHNAGLDTVGKIMDIHHPVKR